MQYKIVVTSSKGGVGKSTTAAYLALCLSQRGKRVLLCDLDLGSRCLDLFFGAQDQAVCDFGDVYSEKVEPSRAIIPCGDVSLCPSSVSLSPQNVDGERLAQTLDSLAEHVDAEFVICDTAGTDMPAKLASWANLALICTTQQPASVRGAEITAHMLRREGLSAVRLVITAFEYHSVKNGERSGLLEMIDRSAVRAIGAVPYDRELFLAQESGEMARRAAPAYRAYENIAARLCGEERKLFSGIRGYKGKKAL